jgi:hypothetical protein
MYNNHPVRISDSGFAHLLKEDIEPQTFCDMIHNPVPCPDRRRFRRSSIELCAYRSGIIYRIILELSYTFEINDYVYLLVHLEPT